ncbi:serine protease 30-like [Styela clava]
MKLYCTATCNFCPLDKCFENNGGCEQQCHWDEKINYCTCNVGFKLNADNRTCSDIDECEDNSTEACPGLSRDHCKNTVGSYTCATCSHNNGYMMSYKRKTCCKVHKSTCGYDSTMASQIQEPHWKNMRIYGGLRAEEGRWPWMVQLISTPENLEPGICGGSLLSKKWVVTAAHCFRNKYSYPINTWTAILGTSQNFLNMRLISDGLEIRMLEEVIIHPEHNLFYHHDIALVKLESQVNYSDVIKPICLPCLETPQEGDMCWTVGYGKTDDNKDSGALREVDVPIASMKSCSKVYADSGRILQQDHMICAGHKEGEKDACNGDSGGPLMCQRKDSCQWYQAGIVSFGKGGCGLKGVYGVYTSMKAHQRWIRRHIGEEATNDICPENACQNLSDNDPKCSSMIERCTKFPDYMKTNCAATCCRLKYGTRPSQCQDEPTFQSTCRKNIKHCSSSIFSSFMKKHCKRTCGIC